jgi:hypothetical protein
MKIFLIVHFEIIIKIEIEMSDTIELREHPKAHFYQVILKRDLMAEFIALGMVIMNGILILLLIIIIIIMGNRAAKS